MTKYGKVWQDVIGSLPKRLQKISENTNGDPVFNRTYHKRKSISRTYHSGKFTVSAFARWTGAKNLRTARLILQRMRDNGGWVGSYISKYRDEKNGQIRYRNIYYLSPKAIKYRNKFGSFTNKKGWLYDRFQVLYYEADEGDRVIGTRRTVKREVLTLE